ncbi:hypothetical protein RUM43_002290 [Polyplax serrata]|uniref:tRNA-splicing endonuclease subunit Sen34 n=1 Tax=Polyplax serrata TaxID=468196 RepID=A0AAN8S2K7_POLSC
MDVSRDREDAICLIEMNGTAYIWSAEDWLRLRKLRIMGTFIGNLAALSKQDKIAALPLALLREETTLLLEKGFACLKSLPNINEPPSEELRQQSMAHRKKVLSDQVEILKSERKREIASKIDVIVTGKVAKRKSQCEISQELEKEEILKKEFDKVDVCKDITLAVNISTRDPWIEDTDMKEYCSKQTTLDADIKYLVFKDLWERGYYITLGEKFGGDYLAYPGDPIKFHAFFVIICLEKCKKLQMQNIITYGRLGQSVKKTVVLSYLDNNDKVSYQSIQWSGF